MWDLGRSLMLEPIALDRMAKAFREEYANNSPFPHVVIDGFLPNAAAEEMLSCFPGPQEIAWRRHEEEEEWKLEFTEHQKMPPPIRQFFFEANSKIFLEFLENLTGLVGLISDPYLEGGGLHQIYPGGFLNVHADFNLHSKLKLDRRLNVLLYLNKNWSEEYNGHLELWDEAVATCVRRISPSFNRCVIFNITDHAFHGHPEVLRCPPGVTRKSLALYYYSNGRPADEMAAGHRTLFCLRPGEMERGSKLARSTRIRRQLRRLLPPIAYEVYAAVQRSIIRR